MFFSSVDIVLNTVNDAQFVKVAQEYHLYFVWRGDRKITVHSTYDGTSVSSINFEEDPVIEEVQISIDDFLEMISSKTKASDVVMPPKTNDNSNLN